MSAAPTHDDGRALGFAQIAARRTLSRLAHEEAVEHLERALSMIERGAPEPEQRMQLVLHKGEALAGMSD